MQPLYGVGWIPMSLVTAADGLLVSAVVMSGRIFFGIGQPFSYGSETWMLQTRRVAVLRAIQ